MSKNKKTAAIKPTFERPVEKYFYEMDETFQGSKLSYAVSIFFVFFGVMGLVWMIPFPQLEFLQRMNVQMFLNWGSFFIAIIIYSYLKLAPTLSYAMLFTIGMMSFFIVQLEYVERDYNIPATIVFLLISMISLIVLWVFCKNEKRHITGNDFLRLLTIGPIWLWSKVFDRLKWKY